MHAGSFWFIVLILPGPFIRLYLLLHRYYCTFLKTCNRFNSGKAMLFKHYILLRFFSLGFLLLDFSFQPEVASSSDLLYGSCFQTVFTQPIFRPLVGVSEIGVWSPYMANEKKYACSVQRFRKPKL